MRSKDWEEKGNRSNGYLLMIQYRIQHLMSQNKRSKSEKGSSGTSQWISPMRGFIYVYLLLFALRGLAFLVFCYSFQMTNAWAFPIVVPIYSLFSLLIFSFEHYFITKKFALGVTNGLIPYVHLSNMLKVAMEQRCTDSGTVLSRSVTTNPVRTGRYGVWDR